MVFLPHMEDLNLRTTPNIGSPAMHLSYIQQSWLYIAASSLASVVGALVVYLDLVLKHLPRFHDFSILRSRRFLSASLSLSSGTILFVAVYKMLPTSRDYLRNGGLLDHQATILQLCLFHFGAIGLRLLTKSIEYFGLRHLHHRHLHHHNTQEQTPETIDQSIHCYSDENDASADPCVTGSVLFATVHGAEQATLADDASVSHGGADIDESSGFSRTPKPGRSPSSGVEPGPASDLAHEQAPDLRNEFNPAERQQDKIHIGRSRPRPRWLTSGQNSTHSRRSSQTLSQASLEDSFLNIGLQSSIAIALHKIPEGFIIFSANKVDANLGFATFVSLFTHNVMESFTMSLSLYMALHSKFRAVLWASFVGAGSQPLGAAMALVLFKAVGDAREDLYGGLFAVTAGVMVNLAFSLFSEALVLSLQSEWCTWFVILGMAVLSTVFAWTSA